MGCEAPEAILRKAYARRGSAASERRTTPGRPGWYDAGTRRRGLVRFEEE